MSHVLEEQAHKGRTESARQASVDKVHISTHTARVKSKRKNPDALDNSPEKTNLSLNKKVKYPGIELAESFGYSLSEYVERLLEVQLVKAGKIKRPFLEELQSSESKRNA